MLSFKDMEAGENGQKTNGKTYEYNFEYFGSSICITAEQAAKIAEILQIMNLSTDIIGRYETTPKTKNHQSETNRSIKTCDAEVQTLEKTVIS